MNNQVALDDRVEKNEAAIIGDDRIVRVIIKIRDAIAELNTEYKGKLDALEQQKHRLEVELIGRLQQRGATQTKTDFGTAFFGESMKVTIADPEAFKAFCRKQDDLDFFQLRVKLEHLKEYIAGSGGEVPPGLSIFREVTLNVRVPTKKGSKSDGATDA